MSGVFDETQMRRILGKYIHDGETLLAGIHAISHETNLKYGSKFACLDTIETALSSDGNLTVENFTPVVG